jgi:hypothetical protein
VRKKDALTGQNAYTQYLKDNTMKTAPSGVCGSYNRKE